jgi:hypothetical protein
VPPITSGLRETIGRLIASDYVSKRPTRNNGRFSWLRRKGCTTIVPTGPFPVARDRAIISIIAVGGIGKSTLACAMARWALSPDPDGRLRPHRMLPVCIAQETTNLAESVTQELRRMLGQEELPADLMRGLMSKRETMLFSCNSRSELWPSRSPAGRRPRSRRR